ncbi:MAG: hypothetical protein ACRCUE_18875, partial [Bosea sp. (in: a-proteobacteria)]
MSIRIAAALAALAFTVTGAVAQTAAPTNPLQPRVVRPAPAPAQAAPAATAPAQAAPAKPARQRS